MKLAIKNYWLSVRHYICLFTCAIAAVACMAQANLVFPNVTTSAASLTVNWTAGTVNNGGHAVTISAGSGTLTASETSCAAPSFSSCNFVYANSSGTVAVTQTASTAAAAGNTLLAYVETGTSGATNTVYPWQASTVFTGGPQGTASFNTSTLGVAGTSVGTLGFNNATSGTITLSPPTGALGTPTLTLPTNAGGIGPVFSCGSTGSGSQTCTAAAATGKTQIYDGESTLSSNAATITFPNAFTSSTSFFCVANDVTTRANPVQMIPATASTATITNTTGGSDVIQWICLGN